MPLYGTVCAGVSFSCYHEELNTCKSTRKIYIPDRTDCAMADCNPIEAIGIPSAAS